VIGESRYWCVFVSEERLVLVGTVVVRFGVVVACVWSEALGGSGARVTCGTTCLMSL